jgi:hypothetical protein
LLLIENIGPNHRTENASGKEPNAQPPYDVAVQPVKYNARRSPSLRELQQAALYQSDR